MKGNPDAEAVINNLAMLLVRPGADPARLARARDLVRRFEGSDQWVLLDTLGWVQLRNGEAEQALVTLEKAASLIEPTPAEVRYHLGMAYVALGRQDEAKTQLTRALETTDRFPGMDEARATLETL